MKDHGLIVWKEDRHGISRRVVDESVSVGDTLTIETEGTISYTGTVDELHHEPTSSTWRRVELQIETPEGEFVNVTTDGEVYNHPEKDRDGEYMGDVDTVYRSD